MYLMYKVSLLGHILVNLLYTLISLFGWWNWSRKKNDDLIVKVSKFSFADLPKSLIIFFFIIAVAYMLMIILQQILKVRLKSWIFSPQEFL